MGRSHEPGIDHRVDEVEQRPVVAVDVEQHDGHADDAELVPRQDLEHLVERAEATGEHDHTVGQFRHACLATVHVVGDLEFGETDVCEFEIPQLLGDDADHLAAAVDHGVGDRSHQPHVAAAVDESVSLPCDLSADRLRRLTEDTPRTDARPAEDTDVCHGSHAGSSRQM